MLQLYLPTSLGLPVGVPTLTMMRGELQMIVRTMFSLTTHSLLPLKMTSARAVNTFLSGLALAICSPLSLSSNKF